MLSVLEPEYSWLYHIFHKCVSYIEIFSDFSHAKHSHEGGFLLDKSTQELHI